MDQFTIEGGARLVGDVTISGSKNASLPVIAATLLADGESVLTNMPGLADTRTMAGVLEALGNTVTREGDTMTVDTRTLSSVEATYDLVRKMRASVLVLGPLLARFGRARVSLPGGCAIGARPVDLHLRGLEAMGATIVLEHGYVDAKAPAGGLQGATFVMDMPSVGATENLVMAATLARGTTVLENAAREPEITELCAYLRAMGARIEGDGTSVIRIEGREALTAAPHRVGPDRIEAGTFIAAAAMTGGDITLHGVDVGHLDAVVSRFEATGCTITPIDTDAVDPAARKLRVQGPARLTAVDITTAPFPGYPTDMQAQLMACMCVAEGTSVIRETIFENRFMHVLELQRMGADIRVDGNQAVVRGKTTLSGAPVMATDLRASASLVLAGLVAEGKTEVLRIYHLDRGYDGLEEKLGKLGANVVRSKQQEDGAR